MSLSQCKVAVLINRNHKKFPIKADYKGLSLSTSMQEHVEIVCEKNTFEGYEICELEARRAINSKNPGSTTTEVIISHKTY